jgi:hypothetical protein
MAVCRKLPKFLFLSVCLLQTRCGLGLEKWEAQNNFMVAADQLCESRPGFITTSGGKCVSIDSRQASSTKNGTGASKFYGPDEALVSDFANPEQQPDAFYSGISEKEYLGRVVRESEYYCGQFLNGLSLDANSSNVSLDVLTTIMTALGTAFTPLSTVHAFTAAGSITSGTKTAIDSDIYARMTIANYAQAIESTYYTRINAYINKLAIANPGNLVESLEISKIMEIHKNCSLQAAQSTINSALKPPSTTPSASLLTVTVTGIEPNTIYSLTGTEISPQKTLHIKYKTPPKKGAATPQIVVAKLIDKALDPRSGFSAADVVLSPVSSSSSSFTISSPSSIQWSVSPSGLLTLSGE